MIGILKIITIKKALKNTLQVKKYIVAKMLSNKEKPMSQRIDTIDELRMNLKEAKIYFKEIFDVYSLVVRVVCKRMEKVHSNGKTAQYIAKGIEGTFKQGTTNDIRQEITEEMRKKGKSLTEKIRNYHEDSIIIATHSYIRYMLKQGVYRQQTISSLRDFLQDSQAL